MSGCTSIRAVLFLLFVPALGPGQVSTPQQISQFEVGRRTFYDFGPPFDFYEIYLVRAKDAGSWIDRVTLTPPGSSCMQPAKVETASASMTDRVGALLEGVNPCTIPEKELRREMKRCKKCLVFSGADVAIQVQCGDRSRVIRASVLDKDIFDSAPNTPKRTSWTMQLLTRMDRSLGSNVMDKPVFPLDEEQQSPPSDSETLRDLSMGKYDALFEGARYKPSDLYRASQHAIPSPNIRVQTSPAVRPDTQVQPVYPRLARFAHVEGKVILKFKIEPDGSTSSVSFESGHPLLRGAAEAAVNSWKFAQSAANQVVVATIEFEANCPTEPAP